MLDTDAVRALAEAAHDGQKDKIGDPYIWHVEAVAAGLVPFGDENLLMGGLLHDVVEDTGWTPERLLRVGVPPQAVRTVDAVTNQAGIPYLSKVRRITSDLSALRVKIADNAHNSRADRRARIGDPDTRTRLKVKYRAARELLWAAASEEDIRAIVGIVNPDLLAELDQQTNNT